jgi:hypothetical protein
VRWMLGRTAATDSGGFPTVFACRARRPRHQAAAAMAASRSRSSRRGLRAAEAAAWVVAVQVHGSPSWLDWGVLPHRAPDAVPGLRSGGYPAGGDLAGGAVARASVNLLPSWPGR